MAFPVKYNFTEDYFRDEDRCGFTESECMKRYWAATLHSLEIFDNICNKYGLKYWAACGTMLGAIRHKGFIPWDDDLDIGMLREDYDKFLEVAESELPPEYRIGSKDDPPEHSYNGITVINSLKAVSFDERVLSEYYFCPFPVGFDIYPYDLVPDDKSVRDAWRGRYLKALLAFNLLKEKGPQDKDTKDALSSLGINPADAVSDIAGVRERIYRYAEKTAAENAPGSCSFVNRFVFLAKDGTFLPLPKEWYKEIVEVPFETGTIPVISHINEATQILFGQNWITPVMNTMSHDYPLYRKHLRYMIDFLEKGGMKLTMLPGPLRYIITEADRLEIGYKK